MKLFGREFKTSEVIMIGLLAVVLLGLLYYQFFSSPLSTAIDKYNREAKALEEEIETAQARVAELKGVQGMLDDLEAVGKLSYMSSYNNSKPEVRFLNDLLADTLAYSINFSSVTRNGDQIRRSFRLQYSTGGFRKARGILEDLQKGDNRCLVGDVKCTIATGGLTTIEAKATFFETMEGATPDAGLPADAAAQQ